MNAKCKSLILALLLVAGAVEFSRGLRVPAQVETFSGTLSIRYVHFDDMSSEPQYDFDETIEVTVEVDTTESSQNVDLLVVLYDPDDNQWDWDDAPEYTTYGSSNDPKTLYLSTAGDLSQWLAYAGGTRRWFVKVIVADADTHLIEDTEYKYFWGGPRPIRHLTCKDSSDPDGTSTTTFYDIDEKACEYTEWDTHGLYITYDVRFKWYGPMGIYRTSDPVDLTPGLSSTSASDSIDIKLNPPGFNPGPWHVEFYFENRYRGRNDFTIEYTGELRYIHVPFHYQEERYYCGPAALEMVFDYYGEAVPQLEIADVARTEPPDEPCKGTCRYDMRRAGHFSNLSTSVGNEMPGSVTGYSARKLGYASFTKSPMTIEDLKNLVDLGYPIIVLTRYNLTSPYGHYRVVVGYDNYNDELVIHDPWNKPVWGYNYGGANVTMSYSLFLDLWEDRDCWGLFVSPWEIVLTSSAIDETTSEISAEVQYPCSAPFSSTQYPASFCNATIFLLDGVDLTEGETPKKTVGGIDAGNAATVSWTVEPSASGYYDLSVQTEGKISGSVGAHGSYPGYNYYDRIGGVQQETLYLGPDIRVPYDYPTIQEAINAAQEEDVIFVSAGTYYENVVVNKTVSLIGENRSTAIVEADWNATCVQVTANNVIITGFTIAYGEYGIHCDSSHNTVSRNKILDNIDGIVLNESFNKLSENELVGNAEAIVNYDPRGPPDFSSNNTISNNNITNSYYGVHLEWSSDNILAGNNVTNNHIGLRLWHSSDNLISENAITSNNHGVLLYYESFNNSLYENYIADNEYGVGFHRHDSLPMSSNNKFCHNNFINNTQQVYIATPGCANFWDAHYPSGGNYWSDYSGNDTYTGPYQNVTGSDGIGDTPYIIDANNTDNYPLMNPWTQLLGDIDGNSKVDPEDFYIFARAYGSIVGDSSYHPRADLDNDGDVDSHDLHILVENYGKAT